MVVVTAWPNGRGERHSSSRRGQQTAGTFGRPVTDRKCLKPVCASAYTYLDGVPRPSGRKGNIVMFGIRAKLLAAFVAVALFTAALGWYTVGGMARLNADQRTLYGR